MVGRMCINFVEGNMWSNYKWHEIGGGYEKIPVDNIFSLL